MNDIRARFEEIWPVPAGIEWRQADGCYWPTPWNDDNYAVSTEWDIRLDTFARCQETTDIYVSLVAELIEDIESLADWANSISEKKMVAGIIDRAKKIMGSKQ